MAADASINVRPASLEDYRQVLDLGPGYFGRNDELPITYTEYFHTRIGNPYVITEAEKVVSSSLEHYIYIYIYIYIYRTQYLCIEEATKPSMGNTCSVLL